jgi:hypothetical protein
MHEVDSLVEGEPHRAANRLEASASLLEVEDARGI